MSAPSVRWRYVRWLIAGAAFPALWACNDRRLEQPVPQPVVELADRWPQDKDKDLDIIFVIDNSSSMEKVQQNVAANFPTFMNVLKAVPGGLPDVHIGVVSTSLGAGAFADVPGCLPGGDRGAFQNAPRGKGGTCSAVPRDAYIISSDKGATNNFQGDIADVFSCIAEIGAGGCGFEHPLAAMRRALGGDPGGAPAENNGFLRKDAYLAVVIIANEDDCSVPPDSDLFDPKQTSVSDPYGPLDSFRCNEFGHLCGGARPPRANASNLSDCRPAEGAGKLTPVSEFVSFLKSTKANPDKVLVAAIAAPATPYGVMLDGAQQPKAVASCTSANGFGFPAVRIKEFVDAFGENGSFSSICADNYSAALEVIARKLAIIFEPQCLEGALMDMDSTLAGLQPDCIVTDETITAAGKVQTPIPSCDSAAPPCWRVRASTDCKSTGRELEIDRGGAPPPPDTTATVKCAVCAQPDDPRCSGV